jgi:hypothetical protein
MISNNNLMILIILLSLLIATAVIITLVKKRKAKINEENWPFYAKPLMSKPEQILYHRLVNALPEHIILAQVQLSRVLGVKKGYNFGEWNNRINRMSVDFIVCRKDASVIAAIELDDKSHEAESRQKADTKKDKALASAKVSIIRWKVEKMPNEETIKKTFSNE